METNKIYLGDAYELIKQIPDKSVDLIYTDIPYLIGITNGKSESEIAKRIEKSKHELKDAKIISGIDYKILDEFVRVCKHIYIYMV